MSLPTPYYDRDGITIYHGDNRDVLATTAEQASLFRLLAPPPDGADLSNYDIRPVSYREAAEMITRNHYLQKPGPCSAAFGLFLGFELKGVICYGTPSSAPLRQGIAGPEHEPDVIELTRLWVSDDVPRNGESFLIGNTIRHCGKEIVVSFADPSQGHVGIVYQATNWLYTGLSAARTDWTIEGDDRHGQTIADKYTADEVRQIYGDRFSLQPRPRKHRYIFLNAPKRRRKALLRKLRYPVLPYPKAGAA